MMFWQPAAIVNGTVATPSLIVIGPVVVAIPDSGQTGVQSPRVAVTYRAGAGESPLPQSAFSCTLTITFVAVPAEKVPENAKLLSEPKWPLPTCV